MAGGNLWVGSMEVAFELRTEQAGALLGFDGIFFRYRENNIGLFPVLAECRELL